jgi:hypothetical protein
MTLTPHPRPTPRLERPALGISALIACVAMAACSPPGQTATESTTVEPGAAAPPTPTPGRDAAMGVGRSAVDLSALSADDIDEVTLDGELRCSFADDDGALLLLAAGNVASAAPAQGAVKLAGAVETVTAPGGFDGMLRGATFTGAGLTIRIQLMGAAPAGGGESPPNPASLSLEPADGAGRTYPGAWTCGP